MNTPDNDLQHYTNLLYDHKFDIDDVIYALCGDGTHDRWFLGTRQGELLTADEGKHLKDGDDNGHWHEIFSLPAGYVDELKTHEKLSLLADDDAARLHEILSETTSLHTLPQHFEEDRVGGWLRERLKEEAMEWLDTRGLIPPSMKHVYDVQAASDRQPTGKFTINILPDDSK